MDYFIDREGQQYGPYTLADLQRYTASGEVLLSDLATSEGMSAPVPVAQIIGTIAVPPPSLPGVPVAEGELFADPPNLHWALVLLFAVLTCALFLPVWDIVQAAWLKKVEPASKALYFYCGSALALVGIFGFSFEAAYSHVPNPLTGIVQIVYYVLVLAGRFTFKSSMEDHFNGPDPMALSLSGVMTFFFGGIYFQYHINDIVRRKQADRLYALGR